MSSVLYPAYQKRSGETLRQILEATEALLEERDFAEITVRDIAKRARRAVGTVYTRVPNKDALLTHLLERYAERSQAGITDLTSRGRKAGWGRRKRVGAVCSWIVHRYVAERGLVRSLAHCLFYEEPAVAASFQQSITAQVAEVVDFIVESLGSARSRPSREAGEFAVVSALAIAQNRVVFGSRSSFRTGFSRRFLITELTKMMLAYLSSGTRKTRA